MYRVYYTSQEDTQSIAHIDFSELKHALNSCEYLRKSGALYVTMVSDYADMIGKPGAKGAGSEYIPQMLN